MLDEKLKALIKRVEDSKLSEENKVKIYARISAGLDMMVMPILLKHMPKDELANFANHPKSVTLDEYSALIQHALSNGNTLGEIEEWMNKMVAEIDASLKKQGV